LEIHHIDGNYLNNTIENLQVLCPNCHSLTLNYKALNNSERPRTQTRKNYCIDCGKKISFDSLRCRDCENKHRITDKPVSREELKNLIRSIPFTQIGRKYGLTDNAIKKWCISYGLPSKKKDINKYTDEEWANI
jgi:DNA-directed RNA polymerase subunit RPC12/RpoP